jgi:hypothetical protein
MTEFCEEFRALEAQIYDMAFADRLNNFLSKIPVDGALHIRNAIHDTRDMEVVYRIAREWAANVHSAIVPAVAGSRRHTPHAPIHPSANKQRLLRHMPAHKPPAEKKPSKSDTDEELDIMDADDEEEIHKIEMSQVTCFRCRRTGHFSRDCKVRIPSQPGQRRFPVKNKPVNNSIFATVMDANAYNIDEKGNEMYAYDYDDDRTYSPSNGEDTEALFTDYDDDNNDDDLKA